MGHLRARSERLINGNPSHRLPLRNPLGDIPIVRFRRTGAHEERVAVVRRAKDVVRHPAAFAFHELVTGARASHRLRESDLRLVLRHATSDTWVFREVFIDGAYDEALALVDDLPSPRIVDLGAHVGMFSLRASERHPAAQVTLVEPDRGNLSVLHSVVARNRALAPKWTVIPAVAGVRDGTARFVEEGSWISRVDSVGDPPPGFAVPPERLVVDAQVVDVLPLLTGADLVKIDIEGSEWAILEDDRLQDAGVKHILLEYHGWACDRPDAYAYAVELLHARGFTRHSPLPSRPAQGVILASRPHP